MKSAWAASHTRKSYLGAQYRRLARRRGPKRAAIAVAHSILVIAYHILKDGTEYSELGADYFDRLDQDRLRRYHLRRLRELGGDLKPPLSPSAQTTGLSEEVTDDPAVLSR